MRPFVDREQEMRTLQKEYEREGSSLVVLYGRRRVGKTTLISEFIKDKNALFFLASEESEAQNRRAFKDRAADFIGSELLRAAEVRDWDTIFKAVMAVPFEQKPVIVLDEFQYIGKSNPAFPSVFQRIWEETLKDRPVMVILCGSLISMMVSQTLSYDSPLYGRRTAQIQLKPIPFRYYREFFPERSVRELVELYSVTGGVPKYIELFSGGGDIYSAIRDNVLDRAGYLYDEPYFLLQKEVAEIGNYFSIIRAIAAGSSRLSAISGALEVKATSLTKYLKTLIDLDILEREVPVAEKNPELCKRGLYRIKDNYIRFWFVFVYPYRGFLESGNEGVVMDRLREGLIPRHTAFVFGEICRQRMWSLSAKGCWPFPFARVGRYWDARTEIDIAALDASGEQAVVGECKYWKGPVGANVLYGLEQKARGAAWGKTPKKIWYVLFSIGGFSDDLKVLAGQRDDLLLIGENDLLPF